MLEDLRDDDEQLDLVLPDHQFGKAVVFGDAAHQDVQPLSVLDLIHDEALHLLFSHLDAVHVTNRLPNLLQFSCLLQFPQNLHNAGSEDIFVLDQIRGKPAHIS